MHSFGIGLSVFNAILAVAFLVISAPVVQNRIEMQKAIKAEQDKVPQLQTDIQSLDRSRVELEAALAREISNVTALVTLGQNQRSELERQQALQTDILNDSDSKLARWQSSLNDVQEEIAARQAEQQRLNQNLQVVQNDLQMHKQQVSDLRQRLSEAEQGVAQATTNIDVLYQKLLELIERSNRQAAERQAVAVGN